MEVFPAAAAEALAGVVVEVFGLVSVITLRVVLVVGCKLELRSRCLALGRRGGISTATEDLLLGWLV